MGSTSSSFKKGAKGVVGCCCYFRLLKHDCPDWLSCGILASIAAQFGLKSISQFKKYLWWFEHKGNALQDLCKAAWYLDRLIDEFDPGTD